MLKRQMKLKCGPGHFSFLSAINRLKKKKEKGMDSQHLWLQSPPPVPALSVFLENTFAHITSFTFESFASPKTRHGGMLAQRQTVLHLGPVV